MTKWLEPEGWYEYVRIRDVRYRTEFLDESSG